jgi:hypothetical protein
VIVEMLSLVPSLLLVQLFRRTRPKPIRGNQVSAVHQTLIQMNVETNKLNRTTNKNSSRQECTLPWWFFFIGYALSFVIVLTRIFFIIVRGIEFGDQKTQAWLTTLIIGFFSSILFLQPLKVKRSISNSSCIE